MLARLRFQGLWPQRTAPYPQDSPGLRPRTSRLGHARILDAEPALTGFFNQAQTRSAGIVVSLSSLYSSQRLEGLAEKSTPRPVFVDIGGGTGAALADILAENQFIPAGRCAVFDLRRTIEDAKTSEKLGGVKLVSGTMFEPLPGEIQGVLEYQFPRVLSDFLDGDIVAALRNVRRVPGPDTRMLIVKELLRLHRSKFAIDQDIAVFKFGGKRRSEALFRELAVSAGFKVSWVFHPEESEFGVLELVPASGRA